MDIRISQYILESGIGLLVFYGFYYFLLRKETFFQLNRAYLLVTALVSILIPLVHFSLPVAEVTSGFSDMETPIFEPTYLPELVQQWHATAPVVWEPLEAAQPAPGFTFGQLLWLIYAIGIAIMSFRFLQKFSVLSRLIRQANKSKEKGYTLVKTKNIQAASFLGYLFWNEEQADNDMILQHELVHIRQRHSLDVLCMEILVIVLWFNPLVYWYRNAIKEVHEYIADQEVVRKNSAYAYACLLVKSQKNNLPPHLFNTFHSFIKKRLLMLQNQPSSNWRLMKYLITMPILAALIIFFALDFSEKLPEEITEPFERAAEYVQNVEQITVVGYKEEQNKLFPKSNGFTTYQIQWEGKTCNCYPESEKTPNYYKCEGFSLTKSKLSQSSSFKLLKNGNPMPVKNLWVRTNGSFELGSGPIQIQELNNYEEGRDFLQAVPVGYTVRFNFETGERAGFHFHAFVNNEQNSLRLTHAAQIGDQTIDIDPMTKLGSYTVDYKTLQKMQDQPISLLMNNGRMRPAAGMKVSVGARYHSFLGKKKVYRLKDFPAAKWAVKPGDRVTIYYYLDDDETEEYTISLKIEQDKDWYKKPRDFTVLWNDKVISDPASIFLDSRQLESLRGKKMEFLINGNKMKVKYIDALFPDLINHPDGKIRSQFKSIPGHRFQVMLDLGIEHLKSGGADFSLVGVELENGLIFNSIRVFLIEQFDPSSLYKNPPQAIFLQKDGAYHLPKPQDLDMKKLHEMRMFSKFPVVLIVNGDYVSSSNTRGKVFEQLQLSEEDEVMIYTPGFHPDNTPIFVPGGYIVINKEGFDIKAYRTNVVKVE